VFYLGVAREWVKRPFIISDVSAGNTTLCLWQHVARKLLVERTCPKVSSNILIYQNDRGDMRVDNRPYVRVDIAFLTQNDPYNIVKFGTP
jgi:hypothetical protein